MSELREWVEKIEDGYLMIRDEACEVMQIMMSGEATDAEIEAFLRAHNKLERDPDEIAGFVEGMLEKATLVDVERKPLLDVCGTGGDGLQTFNISTAAAFVVAGAGVGVAKHGNRAVSSKSGSSDVLEALGVRIDAEPEEVVRGIEDHGFGFFFAPRYHPAMKHVAAARKAVGRSVFNLLGPLVNPAHVRRQVVGVFDASLLRVYAEVLTSLMSERVLVVRGEDGMDELSIAGPTRAIHAGGPDGTVEMTVSPEDVGLVRHPLESIRGGDAAQNARLIELILDGEPGPAADAVVYNAGAALWVADLVPDIRSGVGAARETIASGNAKRALERARGSAA